MTDMGPRSAGVSLDGTTLTVAWRSARAGGAWCSFSAPCDGTTEGIEAAFTELGTNVPAKTRVSVTLMRPLAHARTIALPRMSLAEVEGVLARDWMRFVIGHRMVSHAVSARRVGAGEWRAIFAPSDTLDALARVADAHEWRDPVYQVSDDAISAVAKGDRPELVVVCDGAGPTDAVMTERGQPLSGRRFLSGSNSGDVTAFGGEQSGREQAPIVLIGAAERAKVVARELGGASHRARVEDIGLAHDSTAGATHAVAGTLAAPQLRFSTPSIRAAATRSMRGVTVGLAVAAAAALLLAYGIERAGISRQLDDVRAERAALSSRVAAALAARSELDRDAEVVGTMRDREAQAARTSTLLAALSVALPQGSAFTTFAVSGDTVTVAGESDRAARVYEALKQSPLLTDVRLLGPESQRPAGATANESFGFTARVR